MHALEILQCLTRIRQFRRADFPVYIESRDCRRYRYCNQKRWQKIFIPGTVTAVVRLTSTYFKYEDSDSKQNSLQNYFVSYDLDVEKMRKAAGYLIGEHGLSVSFNVRTDVEDTVRTVTEA